MLPISKLKPKKKKCSKYESKPNLGFCGRKEVLNKVDSLKNEEKLISKAAKEYKKGKKNGLQEKIQGKMYVSALCV